MSGYLAFYRVWYIYTILLLSFDIHGVPHKKDMTSKDFITHFAQLGVIFNSIRHLLQSSAFKSQSLTDENTKREAGSV